MTGIFATPRLAVTMAVCCPSITQSLLLVPHAQTGGLMCSQSKFSAILRNDCDRPLRKPPLVIVLDERVFASAKSKRGR